MQDSKLKTNISRSSFSNSTIKKNSVKKIKRENKTNSYEKTIDNKKVILLKGLCCANCASKIERESKNLDGVINAHVDFVSKKLFVQLDKEREDEILNSIKRIIRKIEPDVEAIVEEGKKTNKIEVVEESNKKELAKILIGSAVFFTPIIFNFSNNIELIIYLISYLIVGGEIVLKAGKNILKGQIFDENFLMVVATIGAIGIKEYPEAVAVMLFYRVGEFFQDLAVNSSRKSIVKLMDIRPDYANVKRNNEIKTVLVEEVMIGEVIVVKPGEKVPLDGVIVKGEATVDTSALTGESMPRDVKTEDNILGGFINKNGILEIKVEKEFKESTVAKILDLVQNATGKKAPTESFITKFARYYTPAVVIAALALAFLPPLIIQGEVFTTWIYRALVFLVVSCPCALVVSIPLSFFGGIGGASRKGILVKGGNYLEALNNVETVIFDKTGTLTKGFFKVTETSPLDSTKEELIKYAAIAEAFSNHPIATSILKEYGKEVDSKGIKDYKEISGFGIKVLYKEEEILAGNKKLMELEGIEYDEKEHHGTIVHVAVNKKYLGFIIISDEIKEDSKKAVAMLNNMNVKTVMLTGDNKNTAENVGNYLGLRKVYSELLPQQKVEKLEEVEKEKSKKGKIIFVGDGINDAPVLARADIGIAMGGIGSDAAIEAADVVIMNDEPSKIITAINIAKKTNKIVWQNIIFALGVKFIILILGAFGIATMWEAVFGDVGVALIAVLNSMRVMRAQ